MNKQQKFLDELEDGKLRLYLFNVSQGDHILIKFPNAEFGIIDFYYTDKIKLKEPPALSFLKYLNNILPKEKSIKISFIYISHPDRDHVKGVDKLLTWITRQNKGLSDELRVLVRQFWWFGGTHLKNNFDNIKKLIKEYQENTGDSEYKKELENNLYKPYRKNLNSILDYIEEEQEDKRSSLLVSTILNLGFLSEITEEVDIYTLAPLPKYALNFYEQDVRKQLAKYAFAYDKEEPNEKRELCDANLASAALLIEYADVFKLMFGADVHKEIWESCMASFDRRNLNKKLPSYDAHFIKASHHGSRNSSSEEIWSRLLSTTSEHPVHIGFSAGYQYGHPHEETLDHINSIKTRNEISGIKFDATNYCTKCLQNHGYEVVNMDWLYERKPHQNPTVSSFLDRMMKSDAIDYDSNMLAAFVYEFDKNNPNEIKVKVGLTNYLKDKRKGRKGIKECPGQYC